MWFVLLGSLAAAGVPAGVDLEDLDRWEFDAERFLDGPTGCWEVVGVASWNWDAGRWGLSRGDAAFAAKLHDGVWGAFHLEPLGEVIRERRETTEQRIYGYEPRWAPLFGRIDGDLVVSNAPSAREELPIDAAQRDPRAEAKEARQEERNAAREERQRERRDEPANEGPTNVLREALDRISGSASITSWAQWDEEKQAVLLVRAVPIEGAGAEAEQSVAFPDGGLPASMDVLFPKTWYRGTLPRVRISDAQAHLRVRPSGGQLFPSTEAFSMEVGILGFTVKGAQTIRYKSIRPCGIEEQGPVAPESPEEELPDDAPAPEVPDGEPAR